PLALVGERDAHVDLRDGVLLAALAIEHADGIAEPLHAGAVEGEAALVLLGMDVAQKMRRLSHSSSSPRSTVTAAPQIQPRTLPGSASGRTSTSTRPGRRISSPWVKTSLRGMISGSTDWMSAPSCPAALPVTGSSRIP